jgi:hypothetical protein
MSDKVRFVEAASFAAQDGAAQSRPLKKGKLPIKIRQFY